MQGDIIEKAKLIIRRGLTQLRELWKTLVVLYVPVVVLFGLLGIISRSSGRITLSYFTRDITAIGHLPFFAGLVSQMGGLLWSAALAICVFSFFILLKQNQDARSSRRFLLQAGILTAVLLLDDFFLFHEDIGPDYLNISEKVIVLFYLLLCAVFLILNLNEILASDFLFLGLALVMFTGSIFFDVADLDDYDQYGFFFSEQFQIFLEDGFKFAGVVTWLVYFARYGYEKINTFTQGTRPGLN